MPSINHLFTLKIFEKDVETSRHTAAGGPAAALRSRASLWTMLAESFLLSGQRSSARGCLRRAQRLRRRAAKEPKALQRSSTELFVDFKERELARRAALIRERLRGAPSGFRRASRCWQSCCGGGFCLV